MACMCVGCDRPVTSRLQVKLNSLQKDMLGYFCAACIIKQCSHTHKR